MRCATLCLLYALLTASPAEPQPPDSTVIIDHVNTPWTFVPIGPDNVTSLVLEDEQSWVLYFHTGFVYEPFRDAADRLRGLVQFGLVDRNDRQTAELLKLDPSVRATFRSLPFGSADAKLSGFLDTDLFDAAADHAGASVPDDAIVRLTGEASLGRLLRDGALSSPSKFTAVFTIRDVTPTLLHRVLSKKLARVYNFGLVTRAKPKRALEDLGLGNYSSPVPGLLVLQPRRDGSGVEISRLDESGIATEDEIVYAEALRYLVEYNRQFRAELPGDNRADDAATLRLTDLLRRERLAFNIVDLSELRDMRRLKDAEKNDGEL